MSCDPNYVHAEWSYYRFEPSMAAAVIFTILFCVSTVIHCIQMVRTRTWYLTAFCIGGLCEFIGYIGRSINANENPGCWTLGPYVVQSLLLLIAPALMAASIYMILGRIILLTDGEIHSPIKRRWLTKAFVLSDVLSILLQAAGGSMMAGSDDGGSDLTESGKNVVVLGLFVQLAVFGLFIVVTGLFHRRLILRPTTKCHQPLVRWQKYLQILYITSSLIWIRSVFRVVEYLEGNDGYLMRHEAFVFVFDALPIFLVMAWMNVFHPSEIGLLLRNEAPITSGLELLSFRPMQRFTQRPITASSESGQ